MGKNDDIFKIDYNELEKISSEPTKQIVKSVIKEKITRELQSTINSIEELYWIGEKSRFNFDNFIDNKMMRGHYRNEPTRLTLGTSEIILAKNQEEQWIIKDTDLDQEIKQCQKLIKSMETDEKMIPLALKECKLVKKKEIILQQWLLKDDEDKREDLEFYFSSY